MEASIIWQVLIFSGGIFTIMEILKHFIKENKHFKKHKPIIPLVIGGLLAPFLAPYVVSGVPWFISLFAGMLSGSLSSSMYELIENKLKKI